MNLFSISDLARFSGIKAHTIRIWEQRYDALKPERSEGNTRYYDGQQLRRLLNIVSLMNLGKKVAQVSALSDKELSALVLELVPPPAGTNGNTSDYFISQLILAGMSYDEHHFEKIFSAGIVRYGLKEMYNNIIYPMLSRIGVMWAGDKMAPPNEHFISNLVRQKMFAAIDALPPPVVENEKWLLFLPEGEYHEMGLLLSNYLIRQSGRQVIYLGVDVPVSHLKDVITATSPTHLLCFIVHREFPEAIDEFLKTLKNSFRKGKIYVATAKDNLKDVKLPAGVVPLYNVEDFVIL
jgi:DNA-binding transcriptional MerR regulator